MPLNVGELVAAVLAVARRPDLWRTAVHQTRVLARPGWWRRAPFLPIPDVGYLHFRLLTMYGGDPSDRRQRRALDPADLVTYLEWCRAWRLVIGPQQ